MESNSLDRALIDYVELSGKEGCLHLVVITIGLINVECDIDVFVNNISRLAGLQQ